MKIIEMEWLQWFGSARNHTLILVSLAFIIAHADEALLPGVYREISSVLHVSPVGLGTLSMIRTITQASCSPLAAYAAVHHNRVSVISLGALLWTLATYASGFSSSYAQIAACRALNGLGLALAFPAIQSLVADSTETHERGFAFGVLQAVGNVGGISGGFCAIMLAGVPDILGVPGWRFAFHLVGTISVVIGFLVYFFAVDPRFANRQPESRVERKSWGSLVTGIRDDMLELGRQSKHVFQIRTFQILVLQGFPGSMPRKTLAFVPMWLELIGYSHKVTAVLMALFVAGNIFGSVFGGRAGDVLSLRFPNTGRIMLAQSSQVFGLMFALVLFMFLQDSPNVEIVFGGVLFLFGFMTCWEAPGTNNPIFAEIVPEKSRTSIFALDRFCESFSSSFASPLVGVLAQKLYGFNFNSTGTGNQVVDDQNAVSLAKAMYVTYTIPMVIAFAIYASLYSTYPRDRDEALNTSKLKSYSPLTGPHLQLEVISNDSNALIMSSSDVADDFDPAFEVSQHTTNYMSKSPRVRIASKLSQKLYCEEQPNYVYS